MFCALSTSFLSEMNKHGAGKIIGVGGGGVETAVSYWLGMNFMQVIIIYNVHVCSMHIVMTGFWLWWVWSFQCQSPTAYNPCSLYVTGNCLWTWVSSLCSVILRHWWNCILRLFSYYFTVFCEIVHGYALLSYHFTVCVKLCLKLCPDAVLRCLWNCVLCNSVLLLLRTGMLLHSGVCVYAKEQV